VIVTPGEGITETDDEREIDELRREIARLHAIIGRSRWAAVYGAAAERLTREHLQQQGAKDRSSPFAFVAIPRIAHEASQIADWCEQCWAEAHKDEVPK